MRALFVFLILIACTPKGFAQEFDASCIDEIESEFGQISSRDTYEFCTEFREGWSFRIHPDLGYNGLLTNGTILRLFNFRQRGYLNRHENTLEFEFVPYLPNVYAIHFRDRGEVFEQDGKTSFYLWGRDVRSISGSFGPYGNKWNPARFIRCFTEAGFGCITYYDVLICKRYVFPEWQYLSFPERFEPVISIRTETPEASEYLLLNFDKAHNLIEEVLERLLEHSCRGDM